jgi:hypothetical protein
LPPADDARPTSPLGAQSKNDPSPHRLSLSSSAAGTSFTTLRIKRPGASPAMPILSYQPRLGNTGDTIIGAANPVGFTIGGITFANILVGSIGKHTITSRSMIL